jgi:hypothetical protein
VTLAGTLVCSSGRLVYVPGGRGVREGALGRFVSAVKTRISWGLPLSTMEKSFCESPVMGLPCLSLTMTLTWTRRAVTRSECPLLESSRDGGQVAAAAERKELWSSPSSRRLEGRD